MTNHPRNVLAVIASTQVPSQGRGLRPSHKALVGHIPLLMCLLLCASPAVRAAGPGATIEPAALGSTVEGARRLGLEIQRLGSQLTDGEDSLTWIDEWKRSHEQLLKNGVLTSR